MLALSEAKRAYSGQDIQDWCSFYGNVPLRFPDAFPLRTVLPLRLTLFYMHHSIETERGKLAKLIHTLFAAAWQHNVDIGKPEPLAAFLLLSPGRLVLQAGLQRNLDTFEALTSLLEEANACSLTKSGLRRRTEAAVHDGCCGVPSFQINGGPVLWGQDRFHYLQDALCGWPLSANGLGKCNL